MTPGEMDIPALIHSVADDAIEACANQRGNDMELSEIIGQIESGGNRKAMRFEPVVYDRTMKVAYPPLAGKIKAINICSNATSLMIYSTSWGMFQFMGMTLYDLGYDKPIMDFVESPDDQVAAFDQFVTKHGIAYSVNELRDTIDRRIAFATHYNGLGNPAAYADRIEAEIKRRDAQT